MRLLNIFAALGLAAVLLTAQQPGQQKGGGKAPQAPKEFASAADVQTLIATAKNNLKAGQAMTNQNILRLAPYNANLEYRVAVGPASQHDTEAEMFYVIEGSGTVVTGGKLVGGTQTNAENWSGTAIEGGVSRAIGKGDFIMVPEKTPHWFSKIEGVLVLMSIHLPLK